MKERSVTWLKVDDKYIVKGKQLDSGQGWNRLNKIYICICFLYTGIYSQEGEIWGENASICFPVEFGYTLLFQM
jgi:hypothetical protein